MKYQKYVFLASEDKLEADLCVGQIIRTNDEKNIRLLSKAYAFNKGLEETVD